MIFLYSLILLLFLIVANFFNIFAITKLLSKTEKYLNRTDITISSIFGNEVSPVFEFGDLVILVYNENDEIIWVSQTTLLKKDDILGQKVYDLISDFDVLTTQEKVKSNYTEIGGKTFEIEINTGLKVVYLKDVSTKVMQDIKVEQERPFIGNIVIDNYQDIIISLGEADFVAYVTEIKEEVMAWAKKYNLFIRSYGNDSFLIVGEEKNYQAILKDNFSIIECRKGLCYTSNPISFENVSEFVVTKEEICYNCLYDSSGRIGYYKDFLENKSYYYNYDLEGKLIKINIFNDTVLDVMTNNHDYIIFTYDEKNNVIETNYYFDGECVITEYNYNNENNLDSIQINDTIFTNPKECVEGAQKFVEKSIGLVEGDFSTTIINEKLYYDTTDVLPIVKAGSVETALTGGNLKTYLGIVEDPDVTPISSFISYQEITINNPFTPTVHSIILVVAVISQNSY